MEAFALVLQSILYPLEWLAQVWTSDEFLWGSLMALFCANMVVKLYLRPFLSDLSAGSDRAGRPKSRKTTNSDNS